MMVTSHQARLHSCEKNERWRLETFFREEVNKELLRLDEAEVEVTAGRRRRQEC